MVNFFLKAKHWQLFLLMFAIPMVIQLAFMAGLFLTMIGPAIEGGEPDPMAIFGYMKWMPVIMLLFFATHYGWLWSVATGLQIKVPENVKMKITKFKIFLLIPVIYMTLLMVLMGFFFSCFNPVAFENATPNPALIIVGMVVFIPLHFLAIFSMFYSIYFVAKTVKTVELQREVAFSDFAAEFFMLWFYLVGVWILQPRINKLAQEIDAAHASER